MNPSRRRIVAGVILLVLVAACVALFYLPVDSRKPYTRVLWVGSQMEFGTLTLVAAAAAPVPPGHRPHPLIVERTVIKHGFGPIVIEDAGPWHPRQESDWSGPAPAPKPRR